MAVNLPPEELERLAAEREARAYRRVTVWAAVGAAAVLASGAYLLGRHHHAATDKGEPARQVTIYCGREGATP